MCVNDVIIEIYKFELISSYLVQGLTKEYKVWSVILFQVDNHHRPNKLASGRGGKEALDKRENIVVFCIYLNETLSSV